MIAEIDPSLQVISVDNGTGVVQHLKTLAHTHVLTCFILLDVNRPGDGWVSTLERVKKHESFSSIPVFVFTTSRYVRDSNWQLDFGQKSLYQNLFVKRNEENYLPTPVMNENFSKTRQSNDFLN